MLEPANAFVVAGVYLSFLLPSFLLDTVVQGRRQAGGNDAGDAGNHADRTLEPSHGRSWSSLQSRRPRVEGTTRWQCVGAVGPTIPTNAAPAEGEAARGNSALCPVCAMRSGRLRWNRDIRSNGLELFHRTGKVRSAEILGRLAGAHRPFINTISTSA